MIATDVKGNAVVQVLAGTGSNATVCEAPLNRVVDCVPVDEETLRVAIVTDDIVEDLYIDQVMESFMTAGFEVSMCDIPRGEKSEEATKRTAILDQLAARHLTRTDMVVALGGDAVCDLAGAAAASYLDGCKFVQIPTTKLAAVG